jgi:hypothetical protein
MLECSWKSVAKTDIGTIRKVNEDAFLDSPQVCGVLLMEWEAMPKVMSPVN